MNTRYFHKWSNSNHKASFNHSTLPIRIACNIGTQGLTSGQEETAKPEAERGEGAANDTQTGVPSPVDPPPAAADTLPGSVSVRCQPTLTANQDPAAPNLPPEAIEKSPAVLFTTGNPRLHSRRKPHWRKTPDLS
ncbi:unnamed protein product [Boreogadus saida]